MKKILSVALMAMTMVFMASCGGNSGKYKYGDPEPKIDTEKGTVNGKAYDNKTEACWEVTTSISGASALSAASTGSTVYVWATEFGVVSLEEYAMWETAQINGALSAKVTASYTYRKTGDKDYESCIGRNEKDRD